MTTPPAAQQWPPSLWAAVTPDGPGFEPLAQSLVVDGAIIGAGFTGLSAAIHLRQRGVSVAVLEAAEPGWGASGRNNGQVIPTLSGHDPSAMVARHGETGERFNRVLCDSAAYLFDLAHRYGIDCEGEQKGWIQPAHSPGRMKLAEKRVREWEALGAPVELLDGKAMASMLGSEAWFGGFWNRTGGPINPLALARGMAHTAHALGAQIFSHSPVKAFEHRNGGWDIRTARATVRAKSLLLATNAYTGELEPGLAPRVGRQVVPVRSWQMATKPVSDNVAKTIIPGRQAMSDTHRELYFARWDARNRLVTGGAGVVAGTLGEKLSAPLAARLKKLWPQLGEVEFDYVWSGFVGMTPDSLTTPHVTGFPRMHRLGPDGYAWVGCNGRAVALSVSLGREFAVAMTSDGRETLALPFSEPRPLPMQSFARRVAPIMLPYFRWLDAREV